MGVLHAGSVVLPVRPGSTSPHLHPYALEHSQVGSGWSASPPAPTPVLAEAREESEGGRAGRGRAGQGRPALLLSAAASAASADGSGASSLQCRVDRG